MKTILVPTDFSAGSEAALNFAMVIARQQGAGLLVIHSRPLPYPAALPPQGLTGAKSAHESYLRSEKLRHFCEKIDDAGDIFYSIELAEGEPAKTIVKAANESGSGLIVMGTHGERDILDHLFGTTATKVLEKAPCPVIAVPPGTTLKKSIEKIACATDYRYSDLQVASTIVAFARQSNAEVILLHVSPEAHEPEKEVNNLYSHLKSVENFTGYPRLSCELLCGDDVESKLIEYVKTSNADMLVMSSQHRNWFERLFRPSLSADMAEEARVPVVVFHHHRQPAPKIYA